MYYEWYSLCTGLGYINMLLLLPILFLNIINTSLVVQLYSVDISVNLALFVLYFCVLFIRNFESVYVSV